MAVPYDKDKPTRSAKSVQKMETWLFSRDWILDAG